MVFVKPGSIALKEAVFRTVPFTLDIDWIIELGRGDDGQEAWLQHSVDELLACCRDGGFLCRG
jgi:hypothetical protein